MGESVISGIVRVDYTESILIGFEPAYLFDLLIASVFCGVNRDIGVLYGFTGLGIDSEQFHAFFTCTADNGFYARYRVVYSRTTGFPVDEHFHNVISGSEMGKGDLFFVGNQRERPVQSVFVGINAVTAIPIVLLRPVLFSGIERQSVGLPIDIYGECIDVAE